MPDDEAEVMRQQVEEMMRTTSFLSPVQTWDKLLAEATKLLHPDHFLAMDIKRVIIQLLGSSFSCQLSQLSEQELQKKIDLCHNYLQVYDKVRRNASQRELHLLKPI